MTVQLERETVVLGEEHDDRLREVLGKVLKGLGATQRSSSWGLGGSQVVESLDVILDGELLHVEAETYMGLSITGSPAANAEGALALLSGTLNRIEDACSGVKAVANPGLRYAGRMYPPMRDMIRELAGGGLEAQTKGQRIIFGSNGSIDIFNKRTGSLVFSKAGE